MNSTENIATDNNNQLIVKPIVKNWDNPTLPDFKIEKLITSSNKSMYMMNFINFEGKETVLVQMLVGNVKVFMTNM